MLAGDTAVISTGCSVLLKKFGTVIRLENSLCFSYKSAHVCVLSVGVRMFVHMCRSR